MKFFTLLLLATVAHAATVQGVVFDEETRIPIARASVTLVPLPGTSAPTASMLANERGQYVFSDVHPGWYLIRVSRIGYEVAEYGQSRPGLPGLPLEVTDQSTHNDGADLRQIVMRRQAAITGTVVDDNSIGIPGWAISVYTARRPIRRIAQGLTDDRGNFRIGELEPGAYIVRSAAGGLEDASTIVPSYFKYGTSVEGAEQVHARLGETQGYVVIHTVEGKLFELTGEVTAPDKRPVRLTLITDTGRRMIATAAGPFTASGVPPGMVELLAEGPACAGYQTLLVDRDMFARVDCEAFASPAVSGALNFPLIARRLDLDGPGPENPRVFGPGRWEFTVRPGPSHYLVSIQNEGDTTPPPSQIEGWFALDAGNAPHLHVTLSAKPASISGVVSSSSNPVIGAPVFLQGMNQSWTTRADAQGNFSFGGLAPGEYRLMSSFDLDDDDPIAREKSLAVTLNEGDAVTKDLELIRQ
jgi:carboxypeptidase family protein